MNSHKIVDSKTDVPQAASVADGDDMRFGVGFFTAQRQPGESRGHTQIYRDLLEHARLIEEVGLDSFWVTEHHFCPDGYMPSTIAVCAAVAGITSRIKIGCGVLAPFYHPVRLAEDLITLDLLSSGRTIAQVGSGYRAAEFEGLGVDQATSPTRMFEVIDILKLAFSSKSFSYSGSFYQIPGIEVTPYPCTPGGPPLVVSGNTEAAAARAAKLNAMYKVDASTSWQQAVRLAAAYDRAWGPGAQQQELHIQCYGFVSDSGDAWSTILNGFVYMREMYNSWGWAAPASISRNPQDYRLLLGNYDAVLEQLAGYRQKFGSRAHITLRLDYPGMDPERVGEGIRLFGRIAEQARKM